jgi:hypothetical protein
MQWLRSFFSKEAAGETTYVSRKVTHRTPLVINNPKIGFLDLLGDSARPLVDEDAAALKPLFSNCLKSEGDAPICDVLMIYATIKADGAIENTTHSLREIIHKSRAPIVVVASENSAQSYIAASKTHGLGRANLVMTLQRNGRSFPDFFKELFGMMHHGTTMPMAWVKLAPQIPGKDHRNVPGTIFSAEVSHILFK